MLNDARILRCRKFRVQYFDESLKTMTILYKHWILKLQGQGNRMQR